GSRAVAAGGARDRRPVGRAGWSAGAPHLAEAGAHLAAGRAGQPRDRLEHDLEVAGALAETRDHGAARGLGEVGSGDEPDPDAAQRLLNDLALTDRESVEHGIEPEYATPVLSDEQVTGPPFQPGDDGQRPAALARLGLRGETAAVADPIADQGHRFVDEPRADELLVL